MDTQQLVSIAYREKLCVSVTVDPTAEAAERWIASVGLDAIAAGATIDDAIGAALTLAILGPEPVAHDVDGGPEPLPFADEPIDDERDDPTALGWLPVLAGR